nr:transposase [Bacillus cereus]
MSDQLAAVYPGSGGNGKAAGVKIQLEYDLLGGQFLHVVLRPAKENDVNYGKKFNLPLIYKIFVYGI